LQETAAQVIAHLQSNPWLSVGIAFLAGLAAGKTVAYERRPGLLLSLIVGSIGFFLGEWVVIYSGLDFYLQQIAEFRIFFDFIAAYLGAFVIAAVIHFVKPL
jgi:uncharacterized membrane protein YeaQ/YmgE (transglycosylase-associated protein family)